MKKIIILSILILSLCGCGANEPEYKIITYCDKKYGIEYLRDADVYRGGITVRLDENGNVIHCKLKELKEVKNNAE